MRSVLPSSSDELEAGVVGGGDHAAHATGAAVVAGADFTEIVSPTAPRKCAGVRSGRSSPGLLTSSV